MDWYPKDNARSPESMSGFFDKRAIDYEHHIRDVVEDFEQFYQVIAQAFPPTREALSILDLGIGTGIELEALFKQCPNARVTGIDVSQGMLNELARKTTWWAPRVSSRLGSFLELDLGRSCFNGVLTSMALHHWPPQVKLDLYRRALAALQPGGIFVNGDYVETKAESARRLSTFLHRSMEERHAFHIDLPLTAEQ